ncbi:hypothetical protein PUN28_012188 [Cardiocondyla obscurior]|uniref:Uncharacterized protein n=1 Tax=Cardiocondyla obscurior TaxID=286306 RepID=A0AAW2FDV4_9HYME
MAFAKLLVLSTVLGGGIGYILFQFTAANESELIKNLPPYSSKPQNCFKRYRTSENLMNQEKRNNNFQEFMNRNDTEK